MRKAEIALVLISQHFDEQGSLSLRQGPDGAVQAVVLVMAHSLVGRITLPVPLVGQPFHLRPAERHFPPSSGYQVDALAAADGHQPCAEPVGMGYLIDMFDAAKPRELNHVIRVFGR